jgi:Na+-driven multidrug efflux pump
MGMGNACGSIVGNLIGSGEDITAKVYAKRSIVTGIGFGIVMSIGLLLCAPLFLSFFDISAATIAICKKTIIVYAAFMTLKAINMILIVGVCRGGGDTIFSGIVDVAAPWLIGLPMAYLGVSVLHLPVFFVMAMINLEEVFKAIFGIYRLLSDKWLHNLVKDIKHQEDETITEAIA